jgi:uncharacterized protein YjiS (DUF1127 family)
MAIASIPEPNDARTRRVHGFFTRCWSALQARRKRARLRATLHRLPDRELKDIGVTRSEIGYLVLTGADERIDPRNCML